MWLTVHHDVGTPSSEYSSSHGFGSVITVDSRVWREDFTGQDSMFIRVSTRFHCAARTRCHILGPD
ncbi:hypothetical protein DPMN_159921 [Dreissena polymorpha]|uniref:Uncharacterized protein n=1 Tax=Dreissena polymorpha TaxID=45954 RepID=A0A9D4EQ41_DREPO|nr:hypothetical protein DPMN_159921 [Dreissena polymorpha]